MSINERNYVGFAISSTTGKPHKIRHLPIMVDWENGVYMYEPGDKFVAGADGIDNLAAQQLANRTEFLRAQNNSLIDTCRGLIDIVKTTTTGKHPVNPFDIIMSSNMPDEHSMWVQVSGKIAGGRTFIMADNKSSMIQVDCSNGIKLYAGGEKSTFPSIIKVLGSLGLMISNSNRQTREAWIEPADSIGEAYDVSLQVVFESGVTSHNPTVMVVNDFDEAYYIKPYSKSSAEGEDEPIGIGDYALATCTDVDEIFCRER